MLAVSPLADRTSAAASRMAVEMWSRTALVVAMVL
jgi:hypothetical protein